MTTAGEQVRLHRLRERGELSALLIELIDELHALAQSMEANLFPRGGQLQSFPGLDPVGSLELS